MQGRKEDDLPDIGCTEERKMITQRRKHSSQINNFYLQINDDQN